MLLLSTQIQPHVMQQPMSNSTSILSINTIETIYVGDGPNTADPICKSITPYLLSMESINTCCIEEDHDANEFDMVYP